MRKIIVLPLMASAALLSGCQLDNQTLGGIAGAGAGAGIAKAAGGGTLAVVVGAAAGAWFGAELGRQLTDRDRSTMRETAQYALDDAPSGTTSRWENPDSGNSGTITPQDSFQNAQGQQCREFHQSVSAAGQTETGYGTACRQADGSWKVVG